MVALIGFALFAGTIAFIFYKNVVKKINDYLISS